jgi:anti-sigma-K factor RskA
VSAGKHCRQAGNARRTDFRSGANTAEGLGMTNQQLHDLTAAYALDALDTDERREYEAHLAGCDQCRSDLAELSGTVGALALTAEDAAPPDDLRGRILDAARAEGAPNVVALRPRRTRVYAAAAAVAAVAAGIAIGLYVGLSGASSPRLAVSVSGGVAQATVSGFDTAPAGKTYELWVIEGKTPQPAGLFPGGDKQVVTLTRPAPNGSTVAVTLERGGGATTPTLPILEQTTVAT